MIVIVDRCMILKEVECVPGTVNFHRMLNILLINGIMLGEVWKQSRIKQRELDIYIEKCYQATYKAKAQEERSIRHVEKKQHAEVRRKKERRRMFFKGKDTSGGGGMDSLASRQ